MSQRTVDTFMTRDPTTITKDRTLATAKTLMRDNGVRHLPVLHEDQVVGILSEREVDLIVAIAERTADEINVGRAMITNVLEVAPDELIARVAQRMAAVKCGSAVVVDEGEVLGIFTTVDALAALAEIATAS